MFRVFVLAALAARCIHAWGEIGHRTVAYLAEQQFTAATSAMVRDVLSDDYAHGRDISDAAVWPDEVKITPEYDWSKGLHFTGGGSPDQLACNVTVCAASACIIRAIANVTDVLRAPNTTAVHAEALKFLLHLVGDIHQPLHANNYKRGGNAIYVRFDNVSHHNDAPLRLHGVWDDFMARKRNGLDFLADDPPREKEAAARWARRLLGSDETGCADPFRGTACPQEWAEESNRLVCPVVFAGNLTQLQTQDLFRSDYYNATVPVMERRIRQAGNRLAAWLNQLSAARQTSDEM